MTFYQISSLETTDFNKQFFYKQLMQIANN